MIELITLKFTPFLLYILGKLIYWLVKKENFYHSYDIYDFSTGAVLIDRALLFIVCQYLGIFFSTPCHVAGWVHYNEDEEGGVVYQKSEIHDPFGVGLSWLVGVPYRPYHFCDNVTWL